MPNRSDGRRVAVAVPALNEEDHVVACVAALLNQADSARVCLSVHVLANNCRDATAAILRRGFPDERRLEVTEVSLLAGFDHAGGARRVAMDIAAAAASGPADIIMATDADTIVDRHWLGRTLAYFDLGYDAVAGRAILRSAELADLCAERRGRLQDLGKYQVLLSYLRRGRAGAADPWPHHGYEGGASVALTGAMYAAIGGCPILPVGEDRALFEAVRAIGGRIRHAVDVKVYTSGRHDGRAAGGMADTLRQWCGQSGSAPIHETWPLNVELGHAPRSPGNALDFDRLPAELARARLLAQASRASERFELSA